MAYSITHTSKTTLDNYTAWVTFSAAAPLKRYELSRTQNLLSKIICYEISGLNNIKLKTNNLTEALNVKLIENKKNSVGSWSIRKNEYFSYFTQYLAIYALKHRDRFRLPSTLLENKILTWKSLSDLESHFQVDFYRSCFAGRVLQVELYICIMCAFLSQLTILTARPF